jgi:Flp pilus assembly protein TadD
MRIAVTAVPLAALSATSILQVKAWEDSFTLFSHCARVTNGDVLALEHLAYACDRMGDQKSAAILLDRVAMFHRTHATLWDKTGEFYAKSGNFAEAARACGNAVKLEPKNPAYRGNLARTLAGLGKNEEAEAEFKASIAIDSRIASVHHHYGLLLDRLGRKEEARAQSEEARRALNVKAVRHGETTDEARGG